MLFLQFSDSAQYATFDSEAPMRLESAIDDETDDFYPSVQAKPVVFADTIKAIIEDLPGRKYQ